MVHLRKLKQSDAPLMLAWMHDEDVVHFMQADFRHKTLNDCEKFIKFAQEDRSNIHLAVADDSDTYMGTVSLKNIDHASAEFAITMRKAAMGKGYAAEAMKQIIEKGINELGLKSIYWYVRPENKRAVRFYDKNGYQRITMDKLCNQLNNSDTTIRNRGVSDRNYIWYLCKETKQQRSESFNSQRQLNMVYLSALVQKFTEEKDD